MDLVVGATGLLGSYICERLRQDGRDVRALVRRTADPGKLGRLENLGVALVYGDLKDPVSLGAACQRVSTVITTASSTLARQEGDSVETVDRRGSLDLVEAALSAGVRRFIYTSIPLNMHDSPLVRAKRGLENAVAASGMEYTVLLANCFMEIWLSPALGFDYPNAKARLFGDGTGASAWVSYRDVGDFAVQALETPAAVNRSLLIGGPENLSQNDVVATFERVTGRKFALDYVPREALMAQRQNAADPLSESFACLMLDAARGNPMDISETLAIMPRRLTSLEEYARQVTRSQTAYA